MRRLSSNHGNFVFASGVSSQTLRVCSHWPKKLSTSAARARGSASIRRTCRSRTPASRSCRESPDRAAHRRECCSRERTTVATPARRRRDDTPSPGASSSGSASMRNRKSGLVSSRSSAARMPVSKSPFCTAALKESHQRLDVVVRHLPAIRTSRQRRQDLRRTGRVLARARGTAHEDAPTARRVFRHAPVVRPADQQRRDRELGAGTSPSRFQIGIRAGPSPSALMPSVLTMVAST